ncbi:hypothetical protein ACSVDA_03785 [Cytobacillus sp. Hm23]
MSKCKCKGDLNKGIICNCEFDTFTLSDGNPQTPFVPIELTTDSILVKEKDCILKIDSMVDLQADIMTLGQIDVNYVVERITGGDATTICMYNVFEERLDSVFTLTPNNTVCDTPPIGSHRYRLSITDANTDLNNMLDSTCRCINVTTFKKDKEK